MFLFNLLSPKLSNKSINMLYHFVTYFASLVFEGEDGLPAVAPRPPPVFTFNVFLAAGDPASSIEIQLWKLETESNECSEKICFV